MIDKQESTDSFKKLCVSQCSCKRDLIVVFSLVRLITKHWCHLVAWVCIFSREGENIVLSRDIGAVTMEQIIC